ncbi:MAG TPA: DUF6569 family protein [Pyrinomonadaceae bacterium]|nr:DUF6569 family protein [Pyrinomonadaceae bacterium]
MKTTNFGRGNPVVWVLSMTLAITVGLVITAQMSGSSPAPQKVKNTKESEYEITGPYSHKNLTVFLVHGPDKLPGKNFLTLQEALEQKKVIVFETKSVNELAIQNLSNEDVYVQSGDIVKGGQQDRMLAVDLIVPGKSGKIPIAAFCVESGRWTKRGDEATSTFASSSESAATKDLKLAAKVSKSQGAVWENVTVAQDKLSSNVGSRVNADVSESSLQLAVENAKVQENVSDYTNELAAVTKKSQSNVIGYVFAINGKVNSADVYASNALFMKLWPKLLKASAVEAVAELQKDGKFETLSADQVKTFLAESETGTATEKEVTARVRLVTRENKQSVFFETVDKADESVWVHRNYIKKN